MGSPSDPIGLLDTLNSNVNQNTPEQNLGDILQSGGKQMPSMAPPQPAANPTRIKQLLGNFFTGAGSAMMKEVGLKTPEELQQQQFQNQVTSQNAKSLSDLRDMESQQYQMVPMQLPSGETIQMPAKSAATVAAAMARGQYGLEGQQTHTINVPGVGAFAWDGTKYSPVQGSQAMQPTLDDTTASLAGLPSSAVGQPLNSASLGNINKAIQAKGYKIQDMGANGTGPNEGMWLMDRAGNKIKQISPNSMVYQRGASFAQNRAANTPFDTVKPGTNEPTTISNLDAIRSGSPRVSTSQSLKLGGQYALFNDAYGILDKVDSLADKVNLDDPGVSSKIAAGYAAIKDPAAKGLPGELISNIFARQPIYNQLSTDERELVLTMAQGKAAGTGLRSILGQAGTNEMQQRLDSAMFPGGQTAASKASLKQQTAATRQLLDRFIVGQPQVGLNAPRTPTALSNRTGGHQGPQNSGNGGSIRVQLPDGRTGSVPAASKDKYLKMGAKIL